MDNNPFIITTGEVCTFLHEAIVVPGASWIPNNSSPRHLIVASLPDITEEQVAELTGPLRFDLCTYHELLVLQMAPANGKTLYEMVWAPLTTLDHIAPDTDDGHTVVVMLVMDHTTGVVMAQRIFTWSPHFHRQMENQFALRQQAPISEARFMERATQMHRDYPDSRKLRERSIAHCRDGS